jgi:hypothetical protein
MYEYKPLFINSIQKTNKNVIDSMIKLNKIKRMINEKENLKK